MRQVDGFSIPTSFQESGRHVCYIGCLGQLIVSWIPGLLVWHATGWRKYIVYFKHPQLILFLGRSVATFAGT